MLIKPFESLSDVNTDNTIRTISTTISYKAAVEGTADVGPGRLIVTKKYLIKNFTSKTSLSFVKVQYVFLHCCKLNIDQSNLSDIGQLNLQYVTTSVYDSDEDHYFGNVIYDCVVKNSQTVHRIFDVKQKPGVTFDNVHTIILNALHVDIVSDTEENGCKFVVAKSTNRTEQLTSEYMLRKYRRIDEFLKDGSIKFISYDPNLKSMFDSFSEDNMLKLSQEMTVKALAEPGSLELRKNAILNETLIEKDILDHILADLTKANLLSVIDDITLIYDHGKVSVTKIEYPFDKMLIKFIKRAIDIYKHVILKSVSSAVELIDDFKLIVTINDMYSLGFVRQNKDSTFRTIGLKDETLCNYLYNTCKSKRYRRRHESSSQANETHFEELMDYFDDEMAYMYN